MTDDPIHELETQLRAAKTALAQALQSTDPVTALRAIAASNDLLAKIDLEKRRRTPPVKAMATKITAEQRLEKVFQMLTTGYSRAAVVQFSAETWGLATRTTDKLIEQATQRFREISNFDPKEQVGEAIARYEKLFGQAVDREDHRGAAMIQEKLCKLLGIEAPAASRVEVSTSPSLESVLRDCHERAIARRAKHDPAA